MNKIDKLDKELEKAREKAAEWQAKIRELFSAYGKLHPMMLGAKDALRIVPYFVLSHLRCHFGRC